jgi:SPP1 gp7 family putative phage head morphogenesis protein
MSDVGIDAAQDDLERVALAIDPAQANEQSIVLANGQVQRALTQLNNTTRNALIAALPAWLANPDRTVEDLRRELEPQSNRARADNIVRTEGTHTLRDGVAIVGGIVGVTQFEWYTMRDERVCPICRPMLGKRRDINGTYDASLPVQEPPPAHPWCRCGEFMVIGSIDT